MYIVQKLISVFQILFELRVFKWSFDVLVTVGEAMKQQQIWFWFYGNHNTDKRSLEDQNWTMPLSCRKTRLNLAELGTTMSSRECWRTVVMGSGVSD